MPGPTPKSPALRQRRNKDVTRATLPAESSPRKRAPKLPALPGRTWHVMTKLWWKDVWASPMAVEYLRADEHGLFRLAVLIDTFWSEPNQPLAAEIRLQQQAYGLSPLDRRRLQWQVAQTEEAIDKFHEKRGRRATPTNDARGVLE